MAYEAKSHLPTQSEASNGSSQTQSVYEWVADTARNNPVLVIGGATAIGAIAVMALTRRSTPTSNLKTYERRLRRQVASAEKALKQSMSSSRVAEGLAEFPAAIAGHIGSWDSSRLEALKNRAQNVVEQAATRVASLMRQ